ncbi:long-chain-fatty-acid-CoA ligase [Chondrus crispus]|uniref:Long-chain-fatty-acid-CoA ligase n=1 Tax=Chondrus crispus TaxID=2769 RepID=R7QUY3_CHOCR|nr:long-chain-fatty-acid-CoA ligase [Chondrus crispus]CDF41291.1 long-chain-fatty-acid-CoA ligase [Chondrus crispus]|eukprot:XP_005711585.1 long-chain-fatty-acid-CoA ligase [Chondrus crispus]
MSLLSTDVSAPLSPDSTVRGCGWATSFDPAVPHPGHPALPSMYALLLRSAAAFPNAPCLGWRASAAPDAPFEWWTYADVVAKTDALGRALRDMGVEKGDRVGMYARNCPQWTLMQYAMLSQGFVVVPIYDTLGPNVVEYVCNHAQVKVVCVSAENYPKLASVRDTGKTPTVSRVVVLGHGDIEPTPEAITGEGVVDIVMVLDEGKSLAKEGVHEPPEVTLDDLMVLMYTSGTTGDPKGVRLSHRAVLASVSSAFAFFDKWDAAFTHEDSMLSYLPLSHIFEQQAEGLMLGKGARIGFYSGDIRKLLNDLEVLKPTVFAGVPRVFARFQQKIEQGVEESSFIKKTLFHWGYARQLRAVENPGVVGRMGLWDRLIFEKVRAKILPKTRLVITGSAPMSGQTNDFLKICFNCPVVQGYGLTETVGGMNCSVPDLSKSGTCGGPLPGVQVKLRDLPDMGYLNQDKPYPRGEVCVKGAIVFDGYHENEKATKEAFTEDGFFRTGDVGQWLEDGSLQIIDRAKNLFKLSQGEYVSPEALEQEYNKAKLCGQIFVYGNSLHATLLAVVVPDVPAAEAWGKHRGLTTMESIAAAPGFKKELLEQLAEIREKSHFKKYETIRDVVIEVSDLNEMGQGFTVDNNLMTPSFKLKRPQLKTKYQGALDALYDQKQ